jgi:beta-glucosidase
LRDVLAAPFRAAIQEANVASVMPSYNDVDGLPVHGSRQLLHDLLRDELGFAGVTVGDYFGVSCLQSFHKLAADIEEAARMALLAGLDVELPSGDCYRSLPGLVDAGRVPIEAVEAACLRVLKQKDLLGLFDHPYVDETAAAGAFDTAADRVLARRAAARSVILLTNDGTLPIRPGQRIALLGPSSNDPRLFLGDYHFPAHLEITHAADGERAPTSGEESTGVLPQVPTETVGAALARRLAVVDDVAEADVAVVCVGGRSGLRQQDTSGEFRDVTDLRLPPEQLALIEETSDRGVPTVVVVIGGRAHSLAEVLPHCNALVLAWLPGEEGGPALAEVLYGDTDPSGRLPVSLLRSAGQVGTHSGVHHGAGRSMIYGDYVDSPSAPLFPFGHGLSYTTWAYSDLIVEAASTAQDLTVSVTVANTGDRPGSDVIQLYFSDDVASVGLPAHRLLGFQRVEVPSGERARVEFRVPAGRLGFTDTDQRYRVEPGSFTFRIAGLQAAATLTGEIVYPNRNTVPPVSSATEA